MIMLSKLASSQVATVAARGATIIRQQSEKIASLEEENHSLREKVASMRRDREIEALASEMEEKGLNADLSFEEKVAHIRGYSDLSQVQEAVKMASAGHIRLASVTDRPGRGDSDPLTAFCLRGD
jgi:hypothetical protein